MLGVIMAGGRGSRLAPVTGDLIPKPMIPICGRPLIEYTIEAMRRSGIDKIVVCVGHLGGVIRDALGDGSRLGVRISYISETQPLSTAGAFYYLKGKTDGDFLVVNGDLMLDVDFGRMIDFHLKSKADVTLLVHPNSHPHDSDLVLAESDGRVNGFARKGKRGDGDFGNKVNAGVYVFSQNVLSCFTQPEPVSMEDTLLPALLEKGSGVFAYVSSEYVRDAGTPERLAAVERDLERGVVAARRLSNKQRCVFLDRDGTLNVYKGLITSPDEIELLPGVAEAVRRINESGMLAVCVTNQPAAARGLCSLDRLVEINNRLITLLGREGAFLDDLVFCPHHPDAGYDGECARLKINCNCRKPKTGLIEACREKYNISLEESWFVGDSPSDVQTGKNAGCKTILLPQCDKNARQSEAVSDHTAVSLDQATEKIILA